MQYCISSGQDENTRMCLPSLKKCERYLQCYSNSADGLSVLYRLAWGADISVKSSVIALISIGFHGSFAGTCKKMGKVEEGGSGDGQDASALFGISCASLAHLSLSCFYCSCTVLWWTCCFFLPFAYPAAYQRSRSVKSLEYLMASAYRLASQTVVCNLIHAKLIRISELFYNICFRSLMALQSLHLNSRRATSLQFLFLTESTSNRFHAW